MSSLAGPDYTFAFFLGLVLANIFRFSIDGISVKRYSLLMHLKGGGGAKFSHPIEPVKHERCNDQNLTERAFLCFTL